ncbi:MAG: TetR/AcrR family transcriptional regulator [Erysipelotrichaceae bacterium]|nr:TetR/AcrR family transcriptional regulator [Erysipelotrichaceae bacterium]
MADSTRKAIIDAFNDLLEEKEFSKITVKDIVLKCGINRNSFYYHFDDIPSLLEEIIAEDLNEIMNYYPKKEQTLDGILKAIYEYLYYKRNKIYHLYISYSTRVYEGKIMRACQGLVDAYCAVVFEGIEIPAKEEEDCKRIIKNLLFGTCVDYVLSCNNNLPVPSYLALADAVRIITKNVKEANHQK